MYATKNAKGQLAWTTEPPKAQAAAASSVERAKAIRQMERALVVKPRENVK